MSLKNLLGAGGLIVEMLGVSILFVKAVVWQEGLDWPGCRLRDFAVRLFEAKREYSVLAGLICLVVGAMLQIIVFLLSDQ